MVSSTVAKTDDGTIQITLTIPYKTIAEERAKAVAEAAKDITIDGFRKGMAPLDKVEAKLGEATIVEKTLTRILPEALGQTVEKEKLALALYPKFELVSAEKDKDWQVRAVSCELPKITLGDYQKEINGTATSAKIWTPEKGKPEEKKEISQGEKENLVLTAILKTSEVKIPKLLIAEEVEARLTSLLARLEKLSLKLESYLASVGKTPEGLRAEYEKQVTESITLELALNEIAKKESVEVKETEIEEAIKASLPEVKEQTISPAQKQMLKGVILRQKTLQSLASKIA